LLNVLLSIRLLVSSAHADVASVSRPGSPRNGLCFLGWETGCGAGVLARTERCIPAGAVRGANLRDRSRKRMLSGAGHGCQSGSGKWGVESRRGFAVRVKKWNRIGPI